MAAPMVRHAWCSRSRFFSNISVNNGYWTKVVCRCYRRGSYRKPVQAFVETAAGLKPISLKNSAPLTDNITDFRHRAQDQIENESDLSYEKLREGDKRFGPVVMAAKNKKSREKEGNFLLEGPRLINEAIQAGVKVQSVYFTHLDLANELPLDDLIDVKLYKVMKSHMKIWSDVSTPQGIMAVCKMPKAGELSLNPRPVPITLICDQIRDPGNMGNILRTAAAVGCKLVLLTKGCVDMWEPKVLRSSAGAHFKTLIMNNVSWEHIGNYISRDSQICLADNRAEVPKPDTTSRRFKTSLKHIMKHNESEETYTETDESNNPMQVNESYTDKESLKHFEQAPLSIQSMFDMDFYAKETALVIGGETEGLSFAARKLCFERGGDVVYLPMAEGVESLNAGTAASVILYDMKRQLLLKQKEQEGEIRTVNGETML